MTAGEANADPLWARDGADWPNRTASRFVRMPGLSWHVQILGSGPVMLLAHGTGASTHSWRDLAPILAERFTIVAPDLPGHGFTGRPPSRRMSLDGMSRDLAALVHELGLAPDVVVGHSAGAAILCRMVLDGRIAPRGIVSLNGALLGFHGLTGRLFSPLARILAREAFVARLVSGLSNRRSVERLLSETGSRLDERGIELYARLVRNPRHVGGALAMMANWDLQGLERDLPRLAVPLLLLVGGNDRSIPPASAHRVKRIVRGARLDERRGLGHLAHEERPAEFASAILDFARSLAETEVG